MATKTNRGEPRLSPHRVAIKLKQRKALELRMAGLHWDEIATALGYAGPSGAIAAVDVALKTTLKPPAENFRALNLERLSKILATFWPDMLRKDLEATDKCFRAIADIRKLLGLDAPIKLDTTTDGEKLAGDTYNVQAIITDPRGREILESLARHLENQPSGNGRSPDANGSKALGSG